MTERFKKGYGNFQNFIEDSTPLIKYLILSLRKAIKPKHKIDRFKYR